MSKTYFFLRKINYAEITMQAGIYNEICVWIQAYHYELKRSVLHKIMGKWFWLEHQQTNKRLISLKYEGQYVCS